MVVSSNCDDESLKVIYKECLNKTYYDPEIGELSNELYRVVEAYHEKCYSNKFDRFKRIFISGIIRAFKSIKESNNEEYLDELLDVFLKGHIDAYSFPYNLKMICLHKDFTEYDLHEFIMNLNLKSKDLENKEYHHVFLKLLYVYIRYKEKYSASFANNEELSFFLTQITHTFNYFYKNNLDPKDLDNSLNYIINNFQLLCSYYYMNGYRNDESEIKRKILEKTLNGEYQNKKTII